MKTIEHSVSVENLENEFLNNYLNLYQYSFQICNNKKTAEDVVHDVYLSLFNNNKLNSRIDNPKAYVYRAIKLNTFQKIKRCKKVCSLNDTKTILQEPSSYKLKDFLKEELILKEIEKLPKKRKQVFIMKRIQNYSVKEISIKLSISRKTVENHLTLALKQLKTAILYDMI